VVLLKIVYRNLKEHKVKTLIIGSIIALGIYVIIVGNSVIDTISAGIRKNFIDTYTGHIIIVPTGRETASIMPDAMEAQDGLLPTIPDFPAVLDYAGSLPEVTALSPQVATIATLQLEEEGGTGFAQLLAVDPEKYRRFFPNNIELLEGNFLKPGQEGIVLSKFTAEMLEDSSGSTVRVGDRLLLTSTNEISGMKIREVPVVGIYKIQVATQAMTSFVDAENLRVLSGMTQVTDIGAVLTEDEQAGLGAVDEEALFGGDDGLLSEANVDDGPPGEEAGVPFFENRLYNAVDPNAWHYLLVRLDEEFRINRVVRDLNRGFEERNLSVNAHPWIDGAGQIALMTTAARTVFNIIVLVVAIVAVIIIMNTLVISITERIAEIGTMRAIGAQRPFIRRMIVLETLFIAVFFGAIGIALGVLTIGIVGAARIETTNVIVQVFAGGSIIRPVISAGSIALSIGAIVLAGIAASLYPASIALRIEPRQAMATK
jgi:putative ABC transport system permease protein